MSNIDRRDVLSGLAVAGALAWSATANAEDPPKGGAGHVHGKDAPAASPPSPQVKAIQDSTAACVAAGRFCLARCTDHLASGSPMMAECQRAVMNMLAVTEAMGAVAGYRSADAKTMKALASACAAFCRTCEKACEPHAKMHEECKACGDACRACAKACDALPG